MKKRNSLLHLSGIVAIVIIAVLTIVLVGICLDWFGGRSDVDDDSYYYDPASKTYVNIMPTTNGNAEEGEPTYVGLEILIRSGMTAEQYNGFKDVIKKYAKNNNIELQRVSYLKDSYSLGGLYVFDFIVVLNVDETALKVRVDSSQGFKDIVGMKVYLWNQKGEEVYYFEVDDNNKCDYLSSCE